MEVTTVWKPNKFSSLISNKIWVWVNFHVAFSPIINPLSANFTKWSNTLKQFVGKLPTCCLSVFDHFVGLAIKGLKHAKISIFQ